ncbi:hypothetical protein [Vreelandella titanicae]|uniref:hypothetical protein n=1 Tax=Vreelandella titanicae TaxID=664683 RepID=UPI001593CEDC|nr:hypothetical protein [Halomonas titanicae]NVE90725.1 hypothetical protein [Halomonas titanicae]
MKKLKAQLNWDTTDVISIQKYLSGYDKGTTIYSGDFTADWLLTDIHSSRWVVRTAKTISNEDGTYKYVRTFNWSRLLPDGTRLDSLENSHFLHFLQKSIFVIIESNVIAPNVSVGSISGFFNAIVPFSQWCFREEVNLNPRSHYLRRLTQERLLRYVKERVSGGIFSTFGVAALFKYHFMEQSGFEINSKNIFRLSSADQQKVIAFLKSKGFYTLSKGGDEVIDRNKFIDAFSLPDQITHNDKFTAFLRQFEPALISRNANVLLPVSLEYEYPGHTTPLISDVISQPENIKTFLGYIKAFLSTKSLFHFELPDSDRFRFDEIQRYIDSNQLQLKHTPWIPLPVCLMMINAAVDWVLNKGDLIIDAMVDVFDLLYAEDYLLRDRSNNSFYEEREVLAEKVLDRYREKIYIACFDYSVRNVFEFRKNPPLTYLLDILRGACLLIIASMKPIRLNELSSLKYDCLYFKENDGFWMMQDIEKAGIRGILPEDAKPIPRIAAKAIILLQKLNDHARKHVASKMEESYLLYGIRYGFDWKSASIGDSEFIRQRLSWFCDHIEVPLDDFGRRWYVNTHELRKSFLLNFFWTFKFSSLDSVRWMAGHANPDHVFEYIQANVEGEEMVEVESEYAYQQLRLFKDGTKTSDLSNIEELYDDVCHHFKVNSISDIKADELKHWLEIQIESGHYEITVYGINSVEESIKADIAIKIS